MRYTVDAQLSSEYARYPTLSPFAFATYLVISRFVVGPSLKVSRLDSLINRRIIPHPNHSTYFNVSTGDYTSYSDTDHFAMHCDHDGVIRNLAA